MRSGGPAPGHSTAYSARAARVLLERRAPAGRARAGRARARPEPCRELPPDADAEPELRVCRARAAALAELVRPGACDEHGGRRPRGRRAALPRDATERGVARLRRTCPTRSLTAGPRRTCPTHSVNSGAARARRTRARRRCDGRASSQLRRVRVAGVDEHAHPERPAARKVDSDETIKLRDLSSAESGPGTVVDAATSPFPSRGVARGVARHSRLRAPARQHRRPGRIRARARSRGRVGARGPRSSHA
jgi:hypothetical protein